jgi:hypothetical protein
LTVTAIILAHYKEREDNLKRIVDDLMAGTVAPDKTIIFVDNPEIVFDDDRVTVIRSSKPFLPNIRFALGMTCDTDYCFFIDDDMTVRKGTLSNFTLYAVNRPDTLLGLEGSILSNTDTPYTDDHSINRGTQLIPVDIIIRTYFIPTKSIAAGFILRLMNPQLPKTSLDDVFLSLGNQYLNKEKNYVIPVGEDTDITELPNGGVGQSYSGDHYANRNIVCKVLMDKYE